MHKAFDQHFWFVSSALVVGSFALGAGVLGWIKYSPEMYMSLIEAGFSWCG